MPSLRGSALYMSWRFHGLGMGCLSCVTLQSCQAIESVDFGRERQHLMTSRPLP